MISGMLLATWTALGVLSARSIPLYAVISAPIIAGISASILWGNEKNTRTENFEVPL